MFSFSLGTSKEEKKERKKEQSNAHVKLERISIRIFSVFFSRNTKEESERDHP
jgi:hypothetical protein